MLTYVSSFETVQQKFLGAIAYLCAFLLAVIVHENAHGFVALKCGDDTAKQMGRLTFNPKAHFSLFGLLMFVFAGIGFAKPVPVNFNNLKGGRKDVVKVSLAGALSNLILAFISAAILSIIVAIASNVTEISNFGYVIFFFFLQFSFISLLINIALIAFNLLPIYPLDGFRIVTAYAKRENPFVKFMYQYGIYVLFGLIILGNLFPALDIFGYYMSFIQKLILKLLSLIFKNLSVLGL